ncbi:F-box protein [Apostasia shenzhenica]|uniref:F-box protein n=1 Tax=Apostasia shenzhenica TaxID=1088818 RepID=A0A2I0B7Q9_9ASPA|nr:F-box protein [Apostasia shenzhenica]
MTDGEDEAWNRETVPRVLQIVGCRLSQRDLCSLLLVSRWCSRALVSQQSLWKALDLREANNAGGRLISVLSLDRYQVKKINLEFARDIDDDHLLLLKSKAIGQLQNLESLNLNGCQKISDKGIEAVASACPNLRILSIYWNVRVTDLSIKYLVMHCKRIIGLNLSGCKNISDRSMHLIGSNYKNLEELNVTRCIKITDGGLQHVLLDCTALKSLNLYALSSLTDRAYEKVANLAHLTFLDLCGAQNLSDHGLSCIARCKSLAMLNLTWCVRVTDVGVIEIADGCRSLEYLSLFGIVGVTDRCLQVLSNNCSKTIATLDVNGCIGIKRRSRDELLKLFPRLVCFKVHS